MAKKLSSIILLSTLPLLFSACSYISSATTAGRLFYYRYEYKSSLQDAQISLHARQSITSHKKQFKDSNISETTFNKEVLLVGQVPNVQAKKHAEQLIKQIPKVRRVYNKLAIRPPISLLAQEEDAAITARVSTRLALSNDLDPSKFKVVTENKVVYLMGIVFPKHAKVAIQIARTTKGVRRVETQFRYLKIVG